MKYWLMKSEPDVYGIDHLRAEKRKTDHWDGIRNYQARNFMRDEMKKGDLAFFYHSNCEEPAIVGVTQREQRIFRGAALAQLVEHRIRNAGVASSSLAGGTVFSMTQPILTNL